MFRRVLVLLISLAVIIACLGARNVKADPGGAVVATSAGDATFVLTRMRYIDAGDAFSCVILDDASAKCFGLGADGQLGSGSTSNIGDGVGASVSASAAIALGSGRTTRAIATGSSHACALLDNYSVKCWGSGVYGRLGYGDTVSRGTTSASMGDALAAVDLGTGRSVRMVTAGAQHTCALLDNNTVTCWGRGANGQLGYGTNQTRGDEPGEMGDAAAAVALGSGRWARSIATGANHTCALLDDYTVKCWGDNSYGQLGQGSLVAIGDGVGASVFASAAIALGSGRVARAVAAGDMHTCALLDNGSVKCWGAGSNGRLGSGRSR
ncbi:MAG: RCC1 domain-containing protein [Ilumatobacteraceae bacterium]